MKTLPTATRGFTLIELLAVVAIVGMLLTLLLPGVQAAREIARRIQCQHRQRQLAIAASDYSGARNGYLPVGSHNSEWTTWAISLLPFLENENLFDQYDRRPFLPETRFNVGDNAKVSATPMPVFACPSDGWAKVRMEGNPVAHNFVACTGNGLYEATPAGWFTSPPLGKDWVRFVRFVGAGTQTLGEEATESWSSQPTTAGFKGGCFIMSGGDEKLTPEEAPALRRPAKAVRMSELTKGRTKIIAFSEVIRQRSSGTGGTDDRRGLTAWGPGSLFTTQRLPNASEPDVMPWSGDCGADDERGGDPPCSAPHYEGEPYAIAARSRHPGGVVVAFCDGHVQFIADGIGALEWANMGTTREEVTIREERQTIRPLPPVSP